MTKKKKLRGKVFLLPSTTPPEIKLLALAGSLELSERRPKVMSCSFRGRNFSFRFLFYGSERSSFNDTQ